MNREFFEHLPLGTNLYGEFTLLKCLSANENGGVYLCSMVDDPKQKTVLKVFRNDRYRARHYKEILNREFEISRSVYHPNILSGIFFFEDEDFVAFSMPYLESGSLADHMETGKHWKAEHIVKVLVQISAGLQALHENGIFHRDIKPSNILFEANGNVKITDFGIVLLEQSGDSNDRECLIGTPEYWAPEYIISGLYDERSDIFSIGVIGYEMMCGRLPPSYEIDAGSRKILVTKPDPDMPPVAELYPRALVRAISKCLNADPANRFQASFELKETLEFMQAWLSLQDVKDECGELLKATHRLAAAASSKRRENLPLTLKISRRGLEGSSLSGLISGNQ